MHKHETGGKRGKMFKSEKARENKYGVLEVTGRWKSAWKTSAENRKSLAGDKMQKFRTDIICCWFSFRTVWYEMCSGSWPFKKQIPEAIIWQVGKGLKQSLANVDVPREVKVCFDKLWF